MVHFLLLRFCLGVGERGELGETGAGGGEGGGVVVLLVWVEIWELVAVGGEGGIPWMLGRCRFSSWREGGRAIGRTWGGGPPETQVDRHVDPGVAILAVKGQASP